jgi:hypothetical protein
MILGTELKLWFVPHVMQHESSLMVPVRLTVVMALVEIEILVRNLTDRSAAPVAEGKDGCSTPYDRMDESRQPKFSVWIARVALRKAHFHDIAGFPAESRKVLVGYKVPPHWLN